MKDFIINTTVACQMDFPGLHVQSTPQVLSAGYHMGFFQGNDLYYYKFHLRSKDTLKEHHDETMYN